MFALYFGLRIRVSSKGGAVAPVEMIDFCVKTQDPMGLASRHVIWE